MEGGREGGRDREGRKGTSVSGLWSLSDCPRQHLASSPSFPLLLSLAKGVHGDKNYFKNMVFYCDKSSIATIDAI